MYNVVLEMGADVFVILAEMEELIVSECILTSIEKSDNELIMNVRERIQEQVHDVEKQPPRFGAASRKRAFTFNFKRPYM
mgnify:CR=1 FL=1